ncbi:MAG: TrpB-like pyridoxal phosphate-dependent enzyme [Halobacteriota archaeon]|nr:TrpB-like pyridoxal phosphate-dependent enzyme [Halobacteriota archaeon]
METKILLGEDEIPKAWYNIQADLPGPLDPPLHPATLEVLGPEDMAPLFPMALIEQEMNTTDRWIEIPEEVRDVYRLWRPSPVYRAHRLEKALDTPAKIYYKWEGVSPPGSHKPNTAVAQAYYNNLEGIKRLTTETGAGQWGSALSFAGMLFGLDITVYMVRISYDMKPYRRVLMEAWGGDVFPSPSDKTEAGRKILGEDPDCIGSLGIAISEAVEDAVTHDDAHYALGSVLNHVMLHQTVIGLESKKQLEKVDEYPDVVIGCVGGGSNFAGTCLPYAKDKLDGRDVRLVAVEPKACPTLTKGEFAYDFGDAVGMAPVVKMYTLGHSYIPPAIHAGGLRYHGDSPIISRMVKDRIVEARSYSQIQTFEAAILFARTEGFIPAPETSHAIKAVVDEAIKAKEDGDEKVILFNNSGHGHFDLKSYQDYLENKLIDYEHSDDEIKKALEALPQPKHN